MSSVANSCCCRPPPDGVPYAYRYNREGDLIISCAKVRRWAPEEAFNFYVLSLSEQNLQPCLWLSENGMRLGTYEGHNGAVWTCDINSEFDLS